MVEEINLFFVILVYVDMGNDDTDTATITFTFESATGDSRTWEIKATQIFCHSVSRYRIVQFFFNFQTQIAR